MVDIHSKFTIIKKVSHKKASLVKDTLIEMMLPLKSWERELNENTNGLIRQFFPKGYDFTTITHAEVIEAQNNLNFRPRKTLGFKTSASHL